MKYDSHHQRSLATKHEQKLYYYLKKSMRFGRGRCTRSSDAGRRAPGAERSRLIALG
jgi:hypothetical protein